MVDASVYVAVDLICKGRSGEAPMYPYPLQIITQSRENANRNFDLIKGHFHWSRKDLKRFIQAVEEAVKPTQNALPSKDACSQARELYGKCLHDLMRSKETYVMGRKKIRAMNDAAEFFGDVQMPLAFCNLNNIVPESNDGLVENAQREFLNEEKRVVYGMFVTMNFYDGGVKTALAPKPFNQLMIQSITPMQEIFVQTVRNIAARKMAPDVVKKSGKGFKLLEPYQYDEILKHIPHTGSVAAPLFKFE